MAAVGLVLLRDRRAVSLFPRWLAWFSFFCAAVFVPITLMPYFLDGPFAWNGIFGFYLPFSIFFIWFFVMTWTLRRSLHRLDEA